MFFKLREITEDVNDQKDDNVIEMEKKYVQIL